MTSIMTDSFTNDINSSASMSVRDSNVTSLSSDFENVTSSLIGIFSVNSLNENSNVTSLEGNLSMTPQEGNLSVTSLEGEFEFNHRLLLNVIAYSVMFVVGTIGNTLVRNYYFFFNFFF